MPAGRTAPPGQVGGVQPHPSRAVRTTAGSWLKTVSQKVAGVVDQPGALCLGVEQRLAVGPVAGAKRVAAEHGVEGVVVGPLQPGRGRPFASDPGPAGRPSKKNCPSWSVTSPSQAARIVASGTLTPVQGSRNVDAGAAIRSTPATGP